MAKKPHKLEWNGVDIDTVLTVNDIHAISAQAAAESTGDLWKGKQRITRIADSGGDDGWVMYLIKDALTGWHKLMTFSVNTTVGKARTRVSTTIESFMTTQQKVMFIPVSSKSMIAHHTYMQFVHKLANTVREADTTAKISIREGVQMQTGPNPARGPSTQPATTPAPPVPAPTPAVNEPATTSEQPAQAAEKPLPPPPPPVLEAPASTAPQAPQAKAAQATEADDRIDDSTRKVPRRPRSAKTWELLLPDGTQVPLATTIVIGRDPTTNDPSARTLTVADSELSVSKTHAQFSIIDGTIMVTDLHSRNGTVRVAPDGDDTECQPGIPTPIDAGWSAELGDYAITVQHSEQST